MNVGGTNFTTLRSTVASNAVLADHVKRAEDNNEFLDSGGGNGGGDGLRSVFVDRDPQHFRFILQYLRNQVELENLTIAESATLTGTSGTPRQMVRLLTSFQVQSFMPHLPSDPKVLAELYVEATYYRIAELQDLLRDQSVWTKVTIFLGFTKVAGFQGNPFVSASKLLVQLRTFAVLGTLSVAGTMTMLLEWCGWSPLAA